MKVMGFIVPTLLDGWAASRIQRVTLALDDCESSDLRTYFAHFTNTAVLTVTGYRTASSIAAAMMPNSQSSTSMLFPKLATLNVRDWKAGNRSAEMATVAMLDSRARVASPIECHWLDVED